MKDPRFDSRLVQEIFFFQTSEIGPWAHSGIMGCSFTGGKVVETCI